MLELHEFGWEQLKSNGSNAKQQLQPILFQIQGFYPFKQISGRQRIRQQNKIIITSFMQGISRTEASSREQLTLSRQEIARQYKENVDSVYDTLTDLVSFSNQLGGRVDSLLHQQEQEFFKAYKSHLITIKEDVLKLEQKIRVQQSKIKEYENEGTIALLLKKVSKLESQLTGLYGVNQRLETDLQEKRVGCDILKKENFRLMEKVKTVIRAKAEDRILTYENSIEQSIEYPSHIKQEQSKNFFPTQLQPPKISKTPNKSLPKSSTVDLINSQNKVLRNRIQSLQVQHNKLLKNTVGIKSLHSQLQGFFLECVETVKKQICSRKQTSKCNLGDFRKQDKIHILNLVLENDEIISYVYNKLFHSKQLVHKIHYDSATIDPSFYQKSRKFKPSIYKRKVNNESDRISLPKIKNRTLEQLLSDT